jgi:hypothetical protein
MLADDVVVTKAAPTDLISAQQIGEARMMVRADACQNVGHRSPARALQTFYWAMKAGDVNALEETIILDAAARKQMAEMLESLAGTERARFERPEQLAAFLMCGTEDAKGYILTREERTDDKSVVRVLTLHPDGTGKFRGSSQTLAQEPEGVWRIVVGSKDMARYREMPVPPPN